MQSLKTKLYKLSGVISGACIVAIMLIILSQIVGRIFGFIIPSAEDFSGYALAASTFFGLAYTFREGGHIRVILLVQRLSPGARKIQESLVLGFGLFVTSFMSFYCWHMVWESYVFNEISSGYIAIPVWIPQVPLGLGALALNLAILDEFIGSLRGRAPSYTLHEDEINLEEV